MLSCMANLLQPAHSLPSATTATASLYCGGCSQPEYVKKKPHRKRPKTVQEDDLWQLRKQRMRFMYKVNQSRPPGELDCKRGSGCARIRLKQYSRNLSSSCRLVRATVVAASSRSLCKQRTSTSADCAPIVHNVKDWARSKWVGGCCRA